MAISVKRNKRNPPPTVEARIVSEPRKSDSSNEPKNYAKDFLLEDFRYLIDSFWKSEQTGETRVNWFLGLVTAVLAGLVALASSEHGPRGEALRVILIASLLLLLTTGVVTLLKVLKRNEATDRYKRGCDAIRQSFKDNFDTDQILLHYDPFSRIKGHERRSFGGLAHIVAALNCLLFAALMGVSVYPIPNAPAFFGDVAGLHGHPYLVAAIALSLGAIVQFNYIGRREEISKNELRRDYPTHCGGIVFRHRGGVAQYLLVGPKKEVPNEWLLPKGHIEEGEGHSEAALREVLEETGILARFICLVGQTKFSTEIEDIRSKYYLMEGLHETKPRESRRMGWFKYEEALQLLSHDQNKRLLRQAEKQRAREVKMNNLIRLAD